MNRQDIEKIVLDYPCENDGGLLDSEIEDILAKYPNIKKHRVEDALLGNTGVLSEKGKFLNYHHDVVTALICGLEDRKLTLMEWD